MRLTTLAGMTLAMAVSAGCTPGMVFSGAKAGMKVVTGAEARVIPIKDIAPATIKDYKSIEIGGVTTDVAPICPPDCVASVRTALRDAIADKDIKKFFPGGGKKLRINAVCRFFKEKKLFGKEARLDMLVTLVDGDSQNELARLYIEGISESPTAGEAKDLAKENAKELRKLLEDRKEGKMGD